MQGQIISLRECTVSGDRRNFLKVWILSSRALLVCRVTPQGNRWILGKKCKYSHSNHEVQAVHRPQTVGRGCWWLSLLFLNKKFLELHHEVTATLYHCSPAVTLALSCSCCLLVEMGEKKKKKKNKSKLFRDANLQNLMYILELVLWFLKEFSWSFISTLHLCLYADLTETSPVFPVVPCGVHGHK